jgi:hypothetical protein
MSSTSRDFNLLSTQSYCLFMWDASSAGVFALLCWVCTLCRLLHTRWKETCSPSDAKRAFLQCHILGVLRVTYLVTGRGAVDKRVCSWPFGFHIVLSGSAIMR